jgi:hypothetical protein
VQIYRKQGSGQVSSSIICEQLLTSPARGGILRYFYLDTVKKLIIYPPGVPDDSYTAGANILEDCGQNL